MMNLSIPFIARPVATTLLTIAIALAGILAFYELPVAPLPQVEFPTISVQANLPGASPETMAATVATPLERSLGAIAGVTEMTSTSSLGSTRIIMQFDLSKNIDGAAREVQAAINAARVLLPSSLPNNPTYRKVNPADSPVMIIALTSATMTRGQMYDSASTVLAQRISQIDGVGQVVVGGGALPAVRVDVDLPSLHARSLSMEDVRTAIVGTNVNRPKGIVDDALHQWQIGANDQARTASDYIPVIVAYQNKAPVRLGDIAQVQDDVQDIRNMGITDGRESVQLIVFRQPGANILETVQRVKDTLPLLKASIPEAIDINVALERTTTIRASLFEVERALSISIGLVILVVFLFLRSARATLIPAIAVPVSLLGTFAAMYLCGYSLNNLSLMAVTVATGFVVDDAIVVLENTMRHIEDGLSPINAAILGAREVGFTVVSMSLSLIAVFIPLLAMGGIIGRLFREFAVTLTVAILVSLVISLTTTPMLCALWLKAKPETPITQPESSLGWRSHINIFCDSLYQKLLSGYARSLSWSLDHIKTTLLILFLTVAANIWLYIHVPKGFFPQQDTGMLVGNVQADQAISFQSMSMKIREFAVIIEQDPAVAHVIAYTGGGQRNSASIFVVLKPLQKRNDQASDIINRLRPKLGRIAGASLFLQAAQDLRIGGRQSNAQFQYSLQSDDLELLRKWEPAIRSAFGSLPELTDVNTDTQDKGLQTSLNIDRDTAMRLGVNVRLVDATLNDSFGQRQVSTIYEPLNQYRVILEADQRFLQNPASLRDIYLKGQQGSLIPLSAFATVSSTKTALAVNHQGLLAASTISFNLASQISLGQATKAIQDAMSSIGVPSSITGSFQGSAKLFQASVSNQPLLIITALAAIYIILGVLYESLIHPLTILSTLPSAGVGAIGALMVLGRDFTVIAFIGVILLIGIVKKNAIMMIDVAIETERIANIQPRTAIYNACLLRLRPILMTTLAALFGALPLALVSGDGAEMRQPLGIAIVGGLLICQILTLYTTPAVYLALDRLRR